MILLQADFDLAHEAATIRWNRHRTDAGNYGQDKSKWGFDDELNATAAEVLVARAVGAEFTELGQRDDGVDVTPDIGVRHTYGATNRLLLHPKDRDELRYVLVVGKLVDKSLGGTWGGLRIAGWTYGRLGKKQPFWTELQQGRPCFAVPQAALRHFGRELMACYPNHSTQN